MRQKLVESDLLECVLGLGGGLFYNSPMKACVVICASSKTADHKNKVLFINAVDEVARERSQSFLRPEHQQKILSAYKAFENRSGFARVVASEDILTLNGSLSIARYIERPSGNGNESEHADLGSAWSAFEQGGKKFWSEMDDLVSMLDGITAGEVHND